MSQAIILDMAPRRSGHSAPKWQYCQPLQAAAPPGEQLQTLEVSMNETKRANSASPEPFAGNSQITTIPDQPVITSLLTNDATAFEALIQLWREQEACHGTMLKCKGAGETSCGHQRGQPTLDHQRNEPKALACERDNQPPESSPRWRRPFPLERCRGTYGKHSPQPSTLKELRK